MHHIKKHILKTLMYTKWARFSDMRPPKVDSNAYSYHLRVLQKEKMVEKTDRGYRLTPEGLSYVDKVSIEKFEPRIQPKLTNMLVIYNEKSEILLIPKSKQPFIESWMLPYGKVHMEDESFYAAAVREADEKLQIQPDGLEHRGSCYIRALVNNVLISSLLANVFTAVVKSDVEPGEHARWVRREDMDDMSLAPATTEVIDTVAVNDGLFFKQFDINW
jgi:ADP-ribose pyrophosphatase YjhB (NUDIX family)